MAPMWVNANKMLYERDVEDELKMKVAKYSWGKGADLKEHVKALKLQFLTKQFLLASIKSFGQLHYQDVSTGEMIANYRTSLRRIEY
ncbi:hypothetical protein C2845_PM11G05780 [Panicum miliaceum]|uniref:Uncharacterized protein n=1 Tax=Panicum miliaceum TaxID=4540 RepID=A0A3L6RSR7_PANMI|nr:hypothetical protein C2845_PM11G05780 [Panicum miliaceum]